MTTLARLPTGSQLQDCVADTVCQAERTVHETALAVTYGCLLVSTVAAVLALLAAVSFALAATLWQRASMDAGVGPGDSRGLVGLLTNGVWLLGLAAQGVGVVLQAAALDRGRVAIIQPLLVTSIVWALPLGYL